MSRWGSSAECATNDRNEFFHAKCYACVEPDLSLERDGSTSPQRKFIFAVRGARNDYDAPMSSSSTRDGEDAINAVKEGEHWILFDTCSDEHMCTEQTAETGEPAAVPSGQLFDAQGGKIKTGGASQVDVAVCDDRGVEHSIDTIFRTGNVQEDIFSAMKVIKKGVFKGILDAEGSYLELKSDPSIRIPLAVRRNSLYIKVRLKGKPEQEYEGFDPNVQGCYVAPVTGEELWENPELQDDNEAAAVDPRTVAEPAPAKMPYSVDMPRTEYPAGLGPGSGIKEMQNKAREWEIPVYGTKAQIWKRLLEHEAKRRRIDWQDRELRGRWS